MVSTSAIEAGDVQLDVVKEARAGGGVVGRALHDGNVLEFAFRNFGSESFQFLGIDFGRVNLACRTNFFSGLEAVGSVARANVRDNCPGLPMGQLGETNDFLVLVATYSRSGAAQGPECGEQKCHDATPAYLPIHVCS